jgi:hypothetical protein
LLFPSFSHSSLKDDFEPSVLPWLNPSNGFPWLLDLNAIWALRPWWTLACFLPSLASSHPMLFLTSDLAHLPHFRSSSMLHFSLFRAFDLLLFLPKTVAFKLFKNHNFY